jgi:hypothetical protein
MKKMYPWKSFLFISIISALFLVTSCKKHETVVPIATPTTLGVYGADSSIYKLLLMAISRIGTQPVNYDLVFDTGSGGMVIDANDIIPSSMIGSNGFVFSGDSTIVNGITITNQTSNIVYGDDCSTTNDTVYGNLAYAQVTVGDVNGNIIIKRLPFFLYYKATMGDGTNYPPHEFDVFGVNEEYDVSFTNNAYITSPFASFNPGNGLAHGFKMAQLNASDFSYEGTYAPILQLGLTTSDVSSSSGFVKNQLTSYKTYGYLPYIQANVTYNTHAFTGYVLFDTGTEPNSFLEDPNSGDTVATLLAPSSSVTIATTNGFNYSYTTSTTENITDVENAACVDISIFGLEFFLGNEYMYDFDDHTLWVKNN